MVLSAVGAGDSHGRGTEKYQKIGTAYRNHNIPRRAPVLFYHFHQIFALRVLLFSVVPG